MVYRIIFRIPISNFCELIRTLQTHKDKSFKVFQGQVFIYSYCETDYSQYYLLHHVQFLLYFSIDFIVITILCCRNLFGVTDTAEVCVSLLITMNTVFVCHLVIVKQTMLYMLKRTARSR